MCSVNLCVEFGSDLRLGENGGMQGRFLIYVGVTDRMRLYVLAVDWSFEEVEGEYKEEGGGDPVEAHEQQHPLLVGSE